MNRAIEWFARNTVAANLLMIVIMVSGAMALPRIVKEFFPDFALDMIRVSVVFRGASPEEVEEGVVVRIEEEISDLEGIKRITSTAAENVGSVMIEATTDADVRKLLDEVKSRVDAIETFPEDAEKPVVEELTNRRQVINVAVFGPADELSLRRAAERVRDEITQIPGITYAELTNAKPYEIAIEIAEADMRRYGLTFDEVAAAVRRSSQDIPGGTIETASGDVQLRTLGQSRLGEEFARIPLRTLADGTRLYVGDVATVRDGFEDTDQKTIFNGLPAQVVQVYRVGDQSILDVAEKVRIYVDEASARLPQGMRMLSFQDQSIAMRGRIDLLLENSAIGLALVFLSLALFLRLRLAFWVSLGIPIAFLGALWLMPVLDVSINMISLFAFLIVLGIVVDDAIVVGESVYTWQERSKRGLFGAIEGTKRVGLPVVFSVLTTIAAFYPLLNIEGNTGKIMRVVPLIVIPTLIFSLIESLFILPAHLRHAPPVDDGHRLGAQGALRSPVVALERLWSPLQRLFAAGLRFVIEKLYKPSLEIALQWRYAALAAGAATLMLTMALVAGGFVKFTFFPQVEADFVAARVTMPLGTPETKTAEVVAKLASAAETLRAEIEDVEGRDVFKHIQEAIGDQPLRGAQQRNSGEGSSFSGSHLGEVSIELSPSEERGTSSAQVVARWRELVGTVPGAQELAFTSSLFSPGEPINVQFAGPTMEVLAAAADRLKAALGEFDGVYDIADSYQAGKQELKLRIEPQGESVGLSLQDLGRQVRQAFFGEEAQRIQRGRDDVRVMARYPESERTTLATLEEMRVRTPDGGEVPFGAVADATLGRGFAAITRVDRQRAINVTAEVDDTKANANEVLAALEKDVIPSLLAEYPGLSYSLEGQGREQADTVGGLVRGFGVALIAIYALIAIPFKSYAQPLIVMSAIPFGLVGAIWGHVLMGLDLTVLSMFGIVALSGVVVNDSIVLVDYINQRRKEGGSVDQAVHEAGVARFRAVMLTSLTTFAGLTPLILERSVQAQFLIPMAVSLGFGVVFSTFITLVLVPAGYLVLEDFKALPGRIFGTAGAPVEEDPAEA